MDIRSSLDSLKSLLGTTPVAPAQTQQTQQGASSINSAFSSDRATLSSAGNEVSQTAADSDVRTDKVASIQSALAAGSYHVSPSAVASKLVESMMSGA